MEPQERILIVCDQDDIRSLLAGELRRAGYLVDLAADNRQATALLGSHGFALSAIDVRVPYGGGLELLAEVKARVSSVEVVVIADQSSRAAACEALRQGADAHLVYPFDVEEFGLVVRRALSHRRLKLEKADVLADLWKQRDETRRMLEASNRLAHANPSPDSIVDEIVGIAKQQLNVSLAVTVFNDSGQVSHSRVPVNFHLGWAPLLAKMPPNVPHLQRLLASASPQGQGYIVDPRARATRHNWPEGEAELPGDPLLVLPCQTRDGRLAGVFWLAAGQPPLSEQSVRRLEIFASQSAGALENARLFASQTRRIAVRNALLETTHRMATLLDVHEIVQTMLDAALQMLPQVDLAVFYYPSDGQGDPRYVALDGNGQTVTTPGLDVATVVQAMQGGQSVHMDNWLAGPAEKPRTLVIEPLVWAGACLGELAVIMRQVHAIDDEYRQVLTTLTRQAAIALQKAQLYAEARRVDEIEALHEAGLAIGRTLNLQETLTTTLSTVCSLTGAAISNVYLYEPERHRIDSVITLGDEQLLSDADRRRSAEIAWNVLGSRKLSLVHETRDSWEPGQPPGGDERPNIQTWLAVPLIVGGAPLGVLDLGSPHAGAFTPDDIRLVQVIASQSAPAIENARLYEELQRRLQQTEALRVISQSISNTLDLHRVLDLVVRSAAITIPVASHSLLYLLDPARHSLALEANFTKQNIGAPSELEAIQTKVISQAVQCQQPVRLTCDAWSVIAAPLIASSSVIGAILLKSPRPDAFLEGDEILLNTFASHASIAIQNANLFRDLSSTYLDLARRQEEILRGHRTLQALFEGITDGLYILDGDLRIVAVNRAEASRLGRSPDSLIGQPCDASLWGESTPLVARLMLNTFESGQGETWESQIDLAKRGPFADRDVRSYPIFGASGEVSQVILLAQDVSEKLQLQASLFRSANLAAIGRLAASIAHQINNPLTVIIANAQVMQMDSDAASPNYPILEDVVQAGARIRRIVENLLDFSTQETYEWFETDLEATIEGALALVAHPLRKSRVTIEKYLSGLPTVIASGSHLKLLWMNLLLNARDAIVAADRHGVIEIRTDQPDPDHVRVRIVDDGIGLAQQYRDRLFQPFFSTKPAGQGLGLGLYTCRVIVERHRGHIEIDNNPGAAGATVDVTLPVERA
jgi:two-component system NtrC family sensor kinase